MSVGHSTDPILPTVLAISGYQHGLRLKLFGKLPCPHRHHQGPRPDLWELLPKIDFILYNSNICRRPT